MKSVADKTWNIFNNYRGGQNLEIYVCPPIGTLNEKCGGQNLEDFVIFVSPLLCSCTLKDKNK